MRAVLACLAPLAVCGLRFAVVVLPPAPLPLGSAAIDRDEIVDTNALDYQELAGSV